MMFHLLKRLSLFLPLLVGAMALMPAETYGQSGGRFTVWTRSQQGATLNRLGYVESSNGIAWVWLSGTTRVLMVDLNQPLRRSGTTMLARYIGYETRGQTNTAYWRPATGGEVFLELGTGRSQVIDGAIRKTYDIWGNRYTGYRSQPVLSSIWTLIRLQP